MDKQQFMYLFSIDKINEPCPIKIGCRMHQTDLPGCTFESKSTKTKQYGSNIIQWKHEISEDSHAR